MKSPSWREVVQFFWLPCLGYTDDGTAVDVSSGQVSRSELTVVRLLFLLRRRRRGARHTENPGAVNHLVCRLPIAEVWLLITSPLPLRRAAVVGAAEELPWSCSSLPGVLAGVWCVVLFSFFSAAGVCN